MASDAASAMEDSPITHPEHIGFIVGVAGIYAAATERAGTAP